MANAISSLNMLMEKRRREVALLPPTSPFSQCGIEATKVALNNVHANRDKWEDIKHRLSPFISTLEKYMVVCGFSMMAGVFETHTRVGYDIEPALFEQLTKKMDLLKLPVGLLQTPHPAIFLNCTGSYMAILLREEVDGEVRIGYCSNNRGMFFLNIIKTDNTIGDVVKRLKINDGLDYKDDDLSDDLNLLINICLYLTGGDLIEQKIAAKTGKKARNLPPSMRTSAIYGVVGGKFLSSMKRYEAALSVNTGTGHQMRPHLRSGHWHLYWTGEGRTVPKVNFLHPCMVNATSIDSSVEIERRVMV